MVKSEQILAVATREIGYHEGPNKHNKFGEWYGMDGVAWCMEFVQWVYHQCGADLPLKTASCGGLLRWYQRNQPECVTDRPVPGCIVIFDFPKTAYSTDHTGIFVRLGADRVTTIDGNTGGVDANGGWVQQKTRKLSYANPKYIVPAILREEDIMDISKLTDADCYQIMARAGAYAKTLPAPDWMQAELTGAIDAGITDGARPMALCTRGEAAIMASRAKD